MWLAFPAFFLFLSVTQPGVIRKGWPGLLVMLTVAAAVAAPLILYLVQNPAAEARIDQLSGPITAILSGNPEPLRQNVRAGLGMITVRGDDLWLYNVPGKPLLGPFLGLLFYLGVSIAVMSAIYPYRPARRGRRSYDDAFRVSSANVFMLLTLIVGIIPALATGVGASMTRVIGMLPALYYFPALAVVWLADWAQRQVGERGATALWTAYGVLLTVSAMLTIHSYFVVWANARDVRVAYHTTLVETLHYLDAHPAVGPDVAMSTITPGRFHDPAIARMMLRRDDLRLRWFDGRSSVVLLDASPGYYVFPEVAPLDPALQPWLSGVSFDRIELRPEDFNRTVEVVLRQASSAVTDPRTVVADNLLAVVDSSVDATLLHPGDEFHVLTMWRILDTPTADLMLFTHALDEADQVVAQQDSLDVPAQEWVPGDAFVQVHTLMLPADLPPGTLRLEIGLYSLPDIVRLPLSSPDGDPIGDSLIIDTVEVGP
jgi:hypothetical protein